VIDSILTEVQLNNTDLRNTSLAFADLSNIDLSYANLRRADLSASNLEGANLTDSDLLGTELELARFNDQTSWPEVFDPTRHSMLGPGSDLSDFVFPVGFEAIGVQLNGADLRGIDMVDVNLSYANLRGVQLRRPSGISTISQTVLRNVNFTGADLRQ
jgi:uncharacterized protein YjbI with pentapeptide repeats